MGYPSAIALFQLHGTALPKSALPSLVEDSDMIYSLLQRRLGY